MSRSRRESASVRRVRCRIRDGTARGSIIGGVGDWSGGRFRRRGMDGQSRYSRIRARLWPLVEDSRTRSMWSKSRAGRKKASQGLLSSSAHLLFFFSLLYPLFQSRPSPKMLQKVAILPSSKSDRPAPPRSHHPTHLRSAPGGIPLSPSSSAPPRFLRLPHPRTRTNHLPLTQRTRRPR